MMYVELGIGLLLMSILGNVIIRHIPNIYCSSRRKFWLYNFMFIVLRQIINVLSYVKVLSDRQIFFCTAALSITITIYFITYIHKTYKIHP